MRSSSASPASVLETQLSTAFPELELYHWEDLQTLNPGLHHGLTAAIATPPMAIVYPQTQAELAAIAQLAHQHNWTVLPCGAGSKLHWGGRAQHIDLVISTAKLKQIVDFAAGDFTLTVEAGATFAEINACLQAQGQQLAFDPSFPETATIGGIVATADTGSLRQRYGGVRDRLIGIQFVRHDGAIAKAGGRVVKNVAGYDLMKLLTGSYGTLGIITQLTFRLYPIPETTQTLIISGTAPEITTLAQQIANSSLTPTALDLISASLVKTLYLGTGIGLVVRFQSIAVSVQQQANQVSTWAAALGLQVSTCDAEEAAEYWQRSRQKLDQLTTPESLTLKFGTRATAAVAVLERLNQLFRDDAWAIVHVASGIGRGSVLRDIGGSRIATWRRFCEDNAGFLSVLAAPASYKAQFDLWGVQTSTQTTMTKIANQFDPQRRYSPGRFVV